MTELSRTKNGCPLGEKIVIAQNIKDTWIIWVQRDRTRKKGHEMKLVAWLVSIIICGSSSIPFVILLIEYASLCFSRKMLDFWSQNWE